MEWVLLDKDRPGNDCEVCGYRVRRRTRCKECELLTCGHCIGVYHCPNTMDDIEDEADLG